MQTKSKFSIVAILIAVFFFSSCAALGGGKNTSAGYISGQSFGSTLLSLYGQYKQTNKIDLSSPSTLLSLTALASNGTKIKENWTDKAFYGDFASGVIAGSNKKVTNSTVDNLLTTVAALDLSSLANSFLGEGAAAANNINANNSTANVLSSLTGILSSFDN